MLTIEDYYVEAIFLVMWSHSGHYFPTKENLFEFLSFMAKNDINNIADVEEKNSVLMVISKN